MYTLTSLFRSTECTHWPPCSEVLNVHTDLLFRITECTHWPPCPWRRRCRSPCLDPAASYTPARSIADQDHCHSDPDATLKTGSESKCKIKLTSERRLSVWRIRPLVCTEIFHEKSYKVLKKVDNAKTYVLFIIKFLVFCMFLSLGVIRAEFAKWPRAGSGLFKFWPEKMISNKTNILRMTVPATTNTGTYINSLLKPISIYGRTFNFCPRSIYWRSRFSTYGILQYL